MSKKVWASLAVGLLLAPWANERSAAQEAAQSPKNEVGEAEVKGETEESAEEPRGPVKLLRTRVAALSPHWLGVECEPVGPALRAQLKLEDGQGLLVNHVLPDSPAAKAGIEPHDVLLQFNDAKLGDVPDLVKAVSAANEQASKLRLIHRGETKEIKITPAKRPDRLALNAEGVAPAIARLKGLLPNQQLPRVAGDEPVRMLFVQPGVVAPFAIALGEMPPNSSLTIAREGDGPAKITYVEGDKKIETTADRVHVLPEPVRALVQRALAGKFDWEFELKTPEGGKLSDRLMLREKSEGRAGVDKPRVEVVPVDPNVRVEKLRLFKSGDADKAADDKGKAIEKPTAPQVSGKPNPIDELRKAVEELRAQVEKLRAEQREVEEAK